MQDWIFEVLVANKNGLCRISKKEYNEFRKF